MSFDSVPSCVQHGVSASDGTVKPYEHCAAFFTFASDKTYGATDNSVWLGASNGTILLCALGALAMIAALIGWVKTENDKLEAQATRLRAARRPQTPGPPAGPTGTLADA
jgi:hypothetical protein